MSILKKLGQTSVGIAAMISGLYVGRKIAEHTDENKNDEIIDELVTDHMYQSILSAKHLLYEKETDDLLVKFVHHALIDAYRNTYMNEPDIVTFEDIQRLKYHMHNLKSLGYGEYCRVINNEISKLMIDFTIISHEDVTSITNQVIKYIVDLIETKKDNDEFIIPTIEW